MNPRAQNFFSHNCYYHFIKFERIEEETKVLNFFSFFRFVSFGRPVWKKTFVRKLKETGEAGKRHENTSSRIKVFSFLFLFFFLIHIQLRHYPQLREISNGFSLGTVLSFSYFLRNYLRSRIQVLSALPTSLLLYYPLLLLLLPPPSFSNKDLIILHRASFFPSSLLR